MNAKETVKYLYEHSHIIQHGHFKDIMQELDKPITEHPDVQRLITKHQTLITKYDTLKAENEKLKRILKKYGKHLNNHNQFCESYKHSDYECNCGFEQALNAAEEAK